jgi:AcrR family transcriptional regulator
VTATASATRLDSAARRVQLLDTAAIVVEEHGVAALTMERLAERAGVSKALPYRHFDNAEGVLIELFRRESRLLATRTVAALDEGGTDEERVRGLVRGYFAAVGERGALLGALTGPGSPVPAAAGERRAGPAFVAGVLRDRFSVPAPAAKAAAGVVVGLLSGAVDAWAHGDAGRRAIEDMTARILMAAIVEARKDHPPA